MRSIRSRAASFRFTLLYMVPALLSLVPALAVAEQSCGALKSLAIANTTITSAEIVPSALAPASPLGTSSKVALPAFCRVKAVVAPSADSAINFEVWMPTQGWNGIFVQLGNGGLAGSISYPPMYQQIAGGYAVAATDDGHTGGGTDGSWALGHPEKVIDFAYRAVHQTNVESKQVIAAFYGRPSSHAYFNGCSEGGREAMMEAQRYPDDFNGILAGSPALAWMDLMNAFAWNAQALLKDPASYIPEAKRPAIEKAALDACGTQQGFSTPYIKDPVACHFDPTPLLCKDAESNSCLTQPQLTALKKIYAGPSDPATGRQLAPGYSAGAEAEPGLPGISYASYIYGSAPPATLDYMFSSNFFGDFVFQNPKYSVLTYDFAHDPDTAKAAVGKLMDANNPDMNAFKAHGGKLMQYHGWYDGSPQPLSSVKYYENVTSKMGSVAKTQSFYRLYMVPGMMHCGSGPGPNSFGNMLDFSGRTDSQHNIFSALREWVEHDKAPDVVATKFPGDDPSKDPSMTLPLCAYPSQAVWSGKGSTSTASNFSCQLPAKK